MRLVSKFGFWLAISLLFALSAAAQSENPAPSFGEIVDVRVINLEVVVTDGKNRVSGLDSEDFRLLVDGEEVPIDYFTEVQGGVAVESAAPAETASVPALAPGEAVGTRYLVFIDDSFTIPAQRNRVLRRLGDQLPLLGAGDHMAVVAFDGSAIEMLTSWTDSVPELERVFDEARERPAHGLRNRLRRLDSTERYLATVVDPRVNDVFLADSRFRYPATPRGSYVYSEVGQVVEAATSVMRGFAKPPGRKVMLLLSGGWPAADFSVFTSTLGYNAWGTDQRLYRPLVDTANRLGYTLYPVDVKGLRSGFGSAEFGSARDAELAADLAREREWVEEGALIHLARETGGRALLDGAAFEALERTVEDTRTYYWLGFTPAWKENDERHQIEVEVRGKGLKVRSRKTFSDLSPQTEMTMLVESAQLFDFPMAGEDQELGVSFGEPQKGGRRKLVVPMKLEIPLDQLTLLPYNKGYAAQLELRVAATDDRGDHADIPVIPIELRGAAPEKGQMGVYELGLKLRDRPHRLLVSVHEPASGNVLSKRIEFLP